MLAVSMELVNVIKFCPLACRYEPMRLIRGRVMDANWQLAEGFGVRLVGAARFVLAASLVGSSSGCLVVHTRERVVREDEQRRSVRFSSPRAQRDFQTAALDPKTRRSNESSNLFGIPFLMFYYHCTKLSENAYYNDQLADCDSDGDGLITDDEVLAFQDFKSRTPNDVSSSPEILARRAPAIDIEVPPTKSRWRLALFTKEAPPAKTQ
jgi:hypothetical protein